MSDDDEVFKRGGTDYEVNRPQTRRRYQPLRGWSTGKQVEVFSCWSPPEINLSTHSDATSDTTNPNPMTDNHDDDETYTSRCPLCFQEKPPRTLENESEYGHMERLASLCPGCVTLIGRLIHGWEYESVTAPDGEMDPEIPAAALTTIRARLRETEEHVTPDDPLGNLPVWRADE